MDKPTLPDNFTGLVSLGKLGEPGTLRDHVVVSALVMVGKPTAIILRSNDDIDIEIPFGEETEFQAKIHGFIQTAQRL
ncbi:unnamed protein product [marine sediment metagenome]|uniref:Uncharacterized protein n=1 Tax=marine sediment metagenome TaxID=412755 RepID=X0VRM7_9ZZZZ